MSFKTGYRFQYEAERNRIYIAFTANVPVGSTKAPQFSASVQLRSFLVNDSGTGTNPTDPTVDPNKSTVVEVDKAATLEEYLSKTENNGPLILN